LKSGLVSMVITSTPIRWLRSVWPSVRFNVQELPFLLLVPPSPRYLARRIREELKEWRANKEMDKWDMLLPDYERTRKVDQLERCIRHWESALNYNPPPTSYTWAVTKWTIKYLKELLKGIGDKWR